MFDLTNPKLTKLAELEGYDDAERFLADSSFDSIVPAICTTPGCDATAEMEPDQRAGHCEFCGTQTMQSGLVIAGII